MCFTNIWQHLQLSSTLYVCAYIKVHNIHACWYVVDVFIYCKIGYFDLRIIKIKKEIFFKQGDILRISTNLQIATFLHVTDTNHALAA